MKKWILRIFLIIILLIVAVWFGGKIYFSFSTTPVEGNVEVTSLLNDVEINYDSMGVPQIYAKTNSDLYFALGWVHAGDRLFHMELIRRVAEGRLAEIFGKDALEFDIFQRKIGFMRKAFAEAGSIPDEQKELISRYCDGINSWVKFKKVLPPEFVILGIEPEPWTVKDIYAVMLFQTWFAHYLMDHDKDYNELIEKFGDKIYDLISEYKEWSPATVFRQENDLTTFNPKNFLMSFASNSMVISPKQTKNGYALHESDPHLQINTVPGFWYIVGLHSNEGINIAGITVPAVPFVVMGHNQYCGFAFTVASVDVVDYYRWKKSESDSTMVLTSNGYTKLKTVTERINIKGEEKPLELNVMITEEGPVVESDSLYYTSLKWAGYDFNTANIISAGFNLQTVYSFKRFREVVTSLGALDVNWTYSDKLGNIGYQLGSPIPKRNYENTYVTLPGEDSLYKWKGYWKLEETPYVFNPAEGFVATSNNQILPPDSKKEIPGFYDPYRIVRSMEILRGKSKFDVSEVQKFQQDLISVKARRWKSLLAKGAYKLGENDLAEKFEAWDGKMDLNSMEGAVFSLWWHELPYVIFSDELKDDYKLGAQILEEVLSKPDEDIIDNKITSTKKENIYDISAAALEKVLINFGTPTLGDISFHTLKHPLSKVKILDYWLNLNRGPFPIGGDNSTLDANFHFFNDETKQFDAVVGPSMRFILDWANVDEFKIIGNLGQSGNPFSPHYDDFLTMMQNGTYWTVPFNRDKVLEKTKSTLLLKSVKNN